LALLPFLAPREKHQAIEELCHYADETTRADERAELLIGLAHHVPADGRNVLRDEILQAIERIQPGGSISGSINIFTGFVRIDNLPDIMGRPSLALLRVARDANRQEHDQLLAKAVKRLFEESASDQQKDLMELAPHLPPATVRALLDEYRGLRGDPTRRQLREAIALRMRSAPLPSSGEVATEAPDRGAETSDDDHSDTIGFHLQSRPLDQIFRLSGPPYGPVLEIRFDDSGRLEPVDVMRGGELGIVGQVVIALVADLSINDLESLHADAQAVDGSAWHWPVALLLERLAATESPQAAVEEARLIWPEAIPPIVTATLARWVPAPLDEAFSADARSQADALPPAERALVLALTLPNLKREGLARGVEELVSLARQLSAAEAQNVLLKTTADGRPGLPAIVRLALVRAKLHEIAERRDLLGTLMVLLPVLTSLSEAGFVQAMADRLVRTGEWIR
jgi:hypothetical protein